MERIEFSTLPETAENMDNTITEPKRVPLAGGCHCGATRYVLFLTLPAPHSQSNPPKAGDQKMQRCNGTTCHKMGLFHAKPADATDDFLLLRPLDPLAALGDYRTSDGEIHFLFCRTCGVRRLAFSGRGEVVHVDAAALGLAAAAGAEGAVLPPTTTTIKAWRAVRGSGSPGFGTYVSVNGHMIDAGQRGFDVRVLTEEKRVQYLDTFSEVGEEKPSR